MVSKISARYFWSSLLLCTALSAAAQPAGTLYDPEPPADSAYVRVLTAGQDERIDVIVDGQARVKNLKSGIASDYMVLEAGKHTLTIRLAGKAPDHITTSVDVVRGNAMTVGFASLKAGTTPIFFPDKANSNKLKALLTVYHLDPNVGALNISSADGKTRVFSDITFGKSASIQVNPISIDLIATAASDGDIKGSPVLKMTQGGNYSVFLLAQDVRKMTAHVQENKTEKYAKKR